MNYRHIYHAGNFADVVKHIILIALMNNLKNKPKPFAVLDAFAGIGLYNLKDERPNKTNEYNNGIGLLYNFSQGNDIPKLISHYIEIIKDFNDSVCNTQPEYYPGSPIIIRSLIRYDDRLIASELHKEDFLELKTNMSCYKNVQIHNLDAYNAIKAFIPPKEKRGLVFLDPAFEVRDEFDRLITALKRTKEVFLTGQVMIWFPIKDSFLVKQFYQKYREVGYKESLLLEFEVSLKSDEGSSDKMNKFGILIANPPFIIDEITKAMDYLVSEIYKGSARYTISDCVN